eukprot:COSAG02_NODE_8730_length_2460_cov_220.264718_1_plen_79_part_10
MQDPESGDFFKLKESSHRIKPVTPSQPRPGWRPADEPDVDVIYVYTRASRNPELMTSSVASPLRSNSALVPTVVPILTV